MRVILAFAVFLSLHSFASQIIEDSDIARINASYPEDLKIRKELNIRHDINVPIEFSITSKGNGGFSLPGLFLVRLFDQHDDGSYFKSGLLRNELIDLDEDGYNELLFWGIAIKTDDESEKVLGEIPVVAILKYDPKSKTFKVIKKSNEIDIYIE
ncbi:hypothetical protein P4S60_18385 [Pseudoalteromonas sp. Hal040]|uniref:hypothetical protein n=1 Tax=unclassified Pseudoalteromonas TaxID=194690 RepID=UPI00301BA761